MSAGRIDEPGGFEVSRDTEPGRAGMSPGLSFAIDVLTAELADADGLAAATLGYIYLIGLGDPLAARQWLERGLGCPEGFRGMLMCSVAAADRDALAKLGSKIGRVRGERAAAGRELAEVWLYHLGDPTSAARALLDAGVSGEDLLRVTLDLANLGAELEGELASGSAEDQLAAAARTWDSSGDPDAVGSATTPGEGLGLLELRVEIACATGDLERECNALERLATALERDDTDSPASLAVRFQLAERFAARGETQQAAARYKELAARNADTPGVATELALRNGLRCAVVARELGDAARHCVTLAERAETNGLSDHVVALQRRAAQLAGTSASGFPDSETTALWQKLRALRPDDSEARCAIERVAFRTSPERHLDALRELAESTRDGRAAYLRAAAARADGAVGDSELAQELVEAALVADPKNELGHVQALWACALSGDDRSETAGRWLQLVSEPTGAILAGAAAMALNAAEPELAIQLVGAPAEGVTARALVAAALADAERWAELAQALADLLDQLGDGRARRLAALELGRVAVAELGDLDRARIAATAAREAGASELSLASLSAAIHRAAGEPALAAESLERGLAELAVPEPRRFRDPGAALAILLDLAELALDLKRPDGALERLADARALGPRHARTLRLWVSAARAAQNGVELLAALRSRFAVALERADKLELAREIAELAGAHESSVEAIAAFRAVLELDSTDQAAIDGLLAIAERDGVWADVENALGGAEESPPLLDLRVRALRELGRYSELVEAMRRQLEQSRSDAERADIATAMAILCEKELGDPDTAVRLYREAASYGSDDPGKRSALIAVLDAQGRWAELVRALRSEADRSRGAVRIALLLRLAEILRSRLERLDEAAVVLEGVLEIDGDNDAALGGLESIYEQQGSDTALLRVLERRAAGAKQVDREETHETRALPEHVPTPPAPRPATAKPEPAAAESGTGHKALLSRRIANLRGAAGDIDGALAAHTEAFAADPTDRATSAAIERLCRDHRRFAELVAHYEVVLDALTSPADRAEWLARKGEVELRYLGAVGSALTSLTAAVELAPDKSEYFELAVAVCTRERDWGRLADLCLRRATALEGAERTSMLRRAARVINRRLDDRGRARELDRQLLEVGEKSPAVLGEIERRATDAQDWELLVQVLERRLDHARGGDDTIALLERIAGVAEDRLVNEQQAISAYLRILEIAPSHKKTLEALSRIAEATEEWKRFLEATERLIRLTTDDAAKALLLFKCGSVLEAKFDDDERAIEYYRAAIEASVKCMPAVHGLRDLYRRRGEWELVVETLELETKLWAEARERAGIYAQIGRIYAEKLAAPRRALDYFESALAVDPESLPANLALFEHYFVTGNWKRALPLAERMSKKAVRAGDPRTRSEFYRRRGVVLRHSGRLAMAVDSVLIALEIDPENPTALDALLDLANAVAKPAATTVADIPDLGPVFVELESVYRRRDNADALLARVLVGRARIAVAAGDLAVARERLGEALALAPRERAVLEAVVTHRLERRDVAGALEALSPISDESDAADRGLALWALLRRAEVTADAQRDGEQACELWERALGLDPNCLEALYRLAAEKLGLGDHAAAAASVERAIEVAAAPERAAQAPELARYYFLLGRAREAAGDGRAATAFRRAADYDPTYPEPSIALARRAFDAGDREAAQTLLVTAAHRAMAELGKAGAVPLQRELARILAAAGDRAAASEAYRGILAVAPSESDRIALAEVHAIDDPGRGAVELERLFCESPGFGPAYQLAVGYYDRLGESARAVRALSAFVAVGMASESDRQSLAARRRQLQWKPPQRALSARERGALVANSPDPALDRIYRELAPMLAERFPLRFAGVDLVHFEQIASPAARAVRSQVELALGGQIELLVGRAVPGGVVGVSFPQPRAVIDLAIVEGPDAELRFALGWVYEVVFRRFGPLLCGPRGRRQQAINLFADLVDNAESPGARAIRSHFPMAIESQLASRGPESIGVFEWATFAAEVPCRAGLLFADDLSAAAAVLARLAEHPVATRPLLSKRDRLTPGLVGYFLCMPHHKLHAAINRA